MIHNRKANSVESVACLPSRFERQETSIGPTRGSWFDRAGLLTGCPRGPLIGSALSSVVPADRRLPYHRCGICRSHFVFHILESEQTATGL